MTIDKEGRKDSVTLYSPRTEYIAMFKLPSFNFRFPDSTDIITPLGFNRKKYITPKNQPIQPNPIRIPASPALLKPPPTQPNRALRPYLKQLLRPHTSFLNLKGQHRQFLFDALFPFFSFFWVTQRIGTWYLQHLKFDWFMNSSFCWCNVPFL